MNQDKKIFIDYPDIVDVSTLSKMLQIGKTKAYCLVRDGIIYSKKVGNNYRIPKSSVILYILQDNTL